MDPQTDPPALPADVSLFGDPALRLFGGTEPTFMSAEATAVPGDASAA